MAERQPSKLNIRVRFSIRAPFHYLQRLATFVDISFSVVRTPLAQGL